MKQFLSLLAKDICSVQPMTTSQTEVFFIDYKFTTPEEERDEELRIRLEEHYELPRSNEEILMEVDIDRFVKKFENTKVHQNIIKAIKENKDCKLGYYKSPNWTWNRLCGREYYTLKDNNGKQIVASLLCMS